MSGDLRRMVARWRTTGDESAIRVWLAERIASGELTPERLSLAAECAIGPAVAASGLCGHERPQFNDFVREIGKWGAPGIVAGFVGVGHAMLGQVHTRTAHTAIAARAIEVADRWLIEGTSATLGFDTWVLESAYQDTEVESANALAARLLLQVSLNAMRHVRSHARTMDATRALLVLGMAVADGVVGVGCLRVGSSASALGATAQSLRQLARRNFQLAPDRQDPLFREMASGLETRIGLWALELPSGMPTSEGPDVDEPPRSGATPPPGEPR